MIDYEASFKKFTEQYGPTFENTIRHFNLTYVEAAKICEFVESLRPEILAIQKASGQSSAITCDEPYYGAAGGGLTYMFTPTGLGTILVVRETITGKELNVTDACEWFFYG